MFYIIIVFVILFTFLAIKRLELAVQLLIFLLPAYLIRFNVGPLPSTVLEVMIWIVFAVWFVKNSGLTQYLRGEEKIKRFLADRKKKIAYPFGVELILLLIISLFAAGVSGFSNPALGIWKAYFFEPVMLYIVVMNIFGGGFKLPKILWPLALSALAVSLLAIYQKLSGNLIGNPYWAALSTRRAVSVFGYPNAVGLYLGPLVLLFVGWLGYATKACKAPYKLRLVIALTIFMSLLAIIFAKSSGALLGVGAGLVAFGMLAGRKSRIAVIAIIILASISCAVVPLARHAVWEKITLEDFSGTVRRIGWRDTWKMLSDGRLILGAGLANFQKTAVPYHQEGFFKSDGTPDFYERLKTDASLRARTWQPLEIYLYPHNIFLNFWSELGLAGMLLFVWIIGKYFFLAFRLIVIPNGAKRREESLKGSVINEKGSLANARDDNRFLVLGLLSAMVAIVVHGFVDVPYFKNDLAVMFWLFIAMISIVDLSVKSVNIKQSKP